jgi:hypothetical protein
VPAVVGQPELDTDVREMRRSLRDRLGEPLARGLRGLTGGLGSPTPLGAA